MCKFIKLFVLVSAYLLIFAVTITQAFETEFHGRLQSSYTLRDTNGFQYGFLDEAYGVQWRNELKFDLTISPEYEHPQSFKVNKFFLSYRGAYDAIFETVDRYDSVREKSTADFELGKDDLELENDLREGFIDLAYERMNQSLVLRVGRQIVQWGEADGFNVVNIVNPQDNSTLMFFDNPEDLATPLWMARLNYSREIFGPFANIGIELVAVPDIRPHQFSVLDDNLDAPYAFGYKQLKATDLPFFHKMSSDYHFTDMGIDLGTINDAEALLTQFGFPDPITKWKDDVPGNSFENMEYGAKLQSSIGSLNLALYYFHGFQDDPAMDFSQYLSSQTLTFKHPEQDMYGISFNYFIQSLNAIIRGEGCLTDSVGLVDLTDTNANIGALLQEIHFPGAEDILPGKTGYVEKKIYYGLLGFDKDLWIRWMNNNSMIHTSWQLFCRHINAWDYDPLYRPFDKQDHYRITTFWWTDFLQGKVHPEMFIMYDPEGTWMTNASLTLTKDGRSFIKITQMSFWGDNDAISPFTKPVDLTKTSEISFRIGYNW